jgi:hypothetical protein
LKYQAHKLPWSEEEERLESVPKIPWVIICAGGRANQSISCPVASTLPFLSVTSGGIGDKIMSE